MEEVNQAFGILYSKTHNDMNRRYIAMECCGGGCCGTKLSFVETNLIHWFD